MGRGFQINYKVPEIQQALNNISAYDGKTRLKIEEAISQSTKAIAAGAKQRVPVRTGNLKKTIKSSFDRGTATGYVKAGKYLGSQSGGYPYAHLVEFGTKPHTIVAKNAKALSIRGGFIEQVNHPGAQEHPFMRPAFEQEKPNLIRNVTQAVKP
jgi:HK97 gp10 family phage protein